MYLSNKLLNLCPGSGELEFNEFCTLASKFLEEEEENPEAMRAELREAFMLYDKEGEYLSSHVRL